MHPLRYLGRIIAWHWGEKTGGPFKTPDQFTKYFAPLYSARCIVGRGEHWISADGITSFSYYSDTGFELTTRFADDSGIVTIKKMTPKPRTLHLELQPNFSESWRLHREEVRKRVQRVKALDRHSIEQFRAYDKYWDSYLSSLQIPITIILPIVSWAVIYLIEILEK